MKNILPIYGNLRYDDIYGRKKAITTRFRVSNRHGVIICLTKLLELRMAKESQTSSHIFMDAEVTNPLDCRWIRSGINPRDNGTH